MKFFSLLISLILVYSCTKKIGQVPKQDSTISNTPTKPNYCLLNDSSIVTYTSILSALFQSNCMLCHAYPSSGGITLDRYDFAVNVAKSNDFMQVIFNTNPDNVTMPPPPQKHLDSCEIKVLTLWIKQGIY